MSKILTLFFSCFLFLHAGYYSTIRGKATDDETGEPLTGVHLHIEDLEIFTETDSAGEFIFPFIYVGDYQIFISFLGFTPYCINISLQAQQVYYLDIKLKPSLLNLEAHVYDADLFFTGQTSNVQIMTSNGIKKYPVSILNEILALQPGVAESDLGLHYRGGNSDELAYYVDGISISGIPCSQPGLSSIDRMSVVNCGPNAEYGNALSGTVDIITKDGGSKHSGQISYLTDKIFSNRALDCGYNKYDLSLGGPLTKRFRYFASTEMMSTDAYQKALYRIPSPRMDDRMFGKLSYLLPGARGRISISGFKSRDQYVVWSPYLKGGNEFKYFENKPMYRMKNSLVSAAIDYQVASKTMISAKIGLSYSDNCFGNRDYTWEEQNGRQWYDDYRLKAEHLIKYLDMDEPPPEVSARHILLDSLLPYHTACSNHGFQALRNNPYGIEGVFFTSGDFPGWSYGQNNNLQTRLDISHFFGKANNLQSGVKFTTYDLKYYENQLPWFYSPFFMYYKRQPRTFAFYLQDKINLKRITGQAGLRFDWLDPRAACAHRYPGDFLDTTTSTADDLLKISPRLGLGILVTDRTQLRFSYTHNYKNPQFKDLYYTGDTATIHWLLEHGFNKFSNVFLYPEKTVAYEFGVEHRYSNKLSFGINAYMKNSSDLIEYLPVEALPIPYFQLQNNGLRTVYGIEVECMAKPSARSAVRVSYNLQTANANEPLPYYHEDDHMYYPDSAGAGNEMLSFPVSWNERNIIKGVIEYGFPRRHAISPLQELTAAIACTYHDGHPYTVEDLRGNYLSDIDAVDTLPGYLNVDLKCSKIIRIKSIVLTLTGLIYNLFNTKQIIEVYPTTGLPDNIGYPDPSIYAFNVITLTSFFYTPQADYNHDGVNSRVELRDEYIAAINDLYADPTNYNGPFRAQIGISVGF